MSYRLFECLGRCRDVISVVFGTENSLTSSEAAWSPHTPGKKHVINWSLRCWADPVSNFTMLCVMLYISSCTRGNYMQILRAAEQVLGSGQVSNTGWDPQMSLSVRVPVQIMLRFCVIISCEGDTSSRAISSFRFEVKTVDSDNWFFSIVWIDIGGSTRSKARDNSIALTGHEGYKLHEFNSSLAVSPSFWHVLSLTL